MKNKRELENNFERYIAFPDEEIGQREATRYKWASSFVKDGYNVLEIGCSNGYGTRLLPKNINYLGIDYDKTIIEVAKDNYQDDNHNFLHGDINEFELGFYDVIIAFEVIEHLDNGLEVVERLKKHCNTLLTSVPYNEPVGFWGEHHKLHGLNESHFKDFTYEYIDANGELRPYPNPETFNLMIMCHRKEILAYMCTKSRYDTTLSLSLMSVANQTLKPDKFILYDDNDDPINLLQIPIYKHIFKIFDDRKIKWEVIFGKKKGQVHGHEFANTYGYKWCWRMDDDVIAENNVLEILYNTVIQEDNIGAVGCSVLIPGLFIEDYKIGENKIEDSISYNIQWSKIKQTTEVDHLHCTFLYRSGIIHYNTGLSRVAHTEETQFTYGLRIEGYKNLVVPGINWHLKDSKGGIRSIHTEQMYDDDENKFKGIIQYGKIFVLNNGLGDHIVFSKLLPLIKQKYKKYTIACCYPEVFEGENIISIAEAKYLLGDFSHYDLYKWMAENNWDDELLLAYKKFLGL